MALQILNTGGPDPEVVVGQIQAAIENALPGAAVDVRCVSPGHFEIKVTSEAFADKPMLKQHQLVYGAIADLMSGDAAPVHAVDRLECSLP
ncbi:MAG: BolA/IbaG family iron-sulfur metabolism protein [Deltaproteobacteria bacterium]|nr:MAG: BolA/IbaG family iron-sulfur metabolism protein [Deltaproteobacteria bacterium]